MCTSQEFVERELMSCSEDRSRVRSASNNELVPRGPGGAIDQTGEGVADANERASLPSQTAGAFYRELPTAFAPFPDTCSTAPSRAFSIIARPVCRTTRLSSARPDGAVMRIMRIVQLSGAAALFSACSGSSMMVGPVTTADAPTVIAVSPTNAAVVATAARPVVITFSRPMMAGMEALVVLHDGGGHRSARGRDSVLVGRPHHDDLHAIGASQGGHELDAPHVAGHQEHGRRLDQSRSVRAPRWTVRHRRNDGHSSRRWDDERRVGPRDDG